MNIVTRIHRYDGESILDSIDLKRLRYFLAVAEAGSFSRAAERLDVAQSHLSRQIMRLEKALGHLLLVRRARHVELTDAGRLLTEESKSVILKLDSLPERLNEAAGGTIGSLCIGFTIGGSFHPIVVQVMESLARHKAQLSLNFHVAPRKALVEAIVDCRVQACIARPPSIGAPEVRVDNLVIEPILLAVNKKHRLAGRDNVELSEIAEEAFVFCDRSWSPETYDDIMVACQSAGFAPRVVYHAPQEVCALALAAAGIGVTFIPASLRTLHADNLRFVSLAGTNLNASLALITRANEHMASVKLLRKRALAIATAIASDQ
jgi:DNA-binding transcriptional LysR family regulator